MSSQLSAVEAANALPVGHRLHEFELRGVIGVGGFGIVYRAFDHSLEREVAIKEYMPASLAGRSGKHQVSLLSQAHAETFALGLGSFVNEARLLARFDHASLVKVHRFWEEHGTAYMVMPLYRGRTLRELRLSMSQPPDEAWIRNLMEHLLGALEVLHREAVYHRDIAPDNILVSGDAAPVLLDFGAARRVISDRSQTLTAILKPSYAPIEQYAESTGLRQGPWTDFYSLGATLHFVITGKPPMPATARAINDDQPRLAGSGQGGLPDRLLQVCDWMIAPRPADRPQNASEVRAALAGRMPIPVRTAPATETSWQNTVVQQTPPEPVFAAVAPPRPRRAGKVLALTAAAAVAAVAVFALGRGVGESRARMPVSAKTTAPAGPSQPPETVAQGLAPVAVATHADVAPPSRADTTTAGEAASVNSAPARKAEGPSAPSTGRRESTTTATTPSKPMRPSRPPAEPEPTPTPAPPVEAPTRAVTVVQGDPRDQCSGRHLIALHRCMVRECEKAAFQGHPQCQKVRAIEERTRRMVNSS